MKGTSRQQDPPRLRVARARARAVISSLLERGEAILAQGSNPTPSSIEAVCRAYKIWSEECVLALRSTVDAPDLIEQLDMDSYRGPRNYSPDHWQIRQNYPQIVSEIKSFLDSLKSYHAGLEYFPEPVGMKAPSSEPYTTHCPTADDLVDSQVYERYRIGLLLHLHRCLGSGEHCVISDVLLQIGCPPALVENLEMDLFEADLIKSTTSGCATLTGAGSKLIRDYIRASFGTENAKSGTSSGVSVTGSPGALVICGNSGNVNASINNGLSEQAILESLSGLIGVVDELAASRNEKEEIRAQLTTALSLIKSDETNKQTAVLVLTGLACRLAKKVGDAAARRIAGGVALAANWLSNKLGIS